MKTVTRAFPFLILIILFPATLFGQADADIAVPSGWLGLGITCECGAKSGESFLLIHGTAPGGPAAEANLETGDIVLQIDGKSVGCQRQVDVLELFRQLRGGQRVGLSILRLGEQMEVDLEAIPMPVQLAEMWSEQYRRVARDPANCGQAASSGASKADADAKR